LAYMRLTIDDAFVWSGLYRVDDNNGMLICTKL
jgi:DNA-binding cell septation regulator SpoVG